MPKNTWPDPKAYESQAKVLLQRFREQAQKLGIEADDLLA
jgi:ATP-dependent phosphoenolpyruvate carboxykinase